MKKGLGRGIDALFSELSLDQEQIFLQVPLHLIDRNEAQPRQDFSQEDLRSLADSIASVGIIQPLTVMKNRDRYTLVAGERRFRAAHLAGLKEVPCLLVEAQEQKKAEIALIENIQRQDLNSVEKALALKNYLEKNALTQEEAAHRLGLSRPSLANLLRLLRLPQEVLQLIREGKLTEGHARALCMADEKDVLAYAEKIIAQDLSVRQAEALCKERPTQVKKRLPDAQLEDLAETFRQNLGTQVVIRGSMKKGRVVLSYSSQDELERICEVLKKN